MVTNSVVPRLWRRIYRVRLCMAADYRGGLPPQPSSKFTGDPSAGADVLRDAGPSTQLTCADVVAIANDRATALQAALLPRALCRHGRRPFSSGLHADYVWPARP